ncbi:(S)-benzoin forming benzil reductase [Oceanobacillus jordanicus]|uniref:(S)-benzoin forming benzil reductase n=1 Tax=Oceanobacillus jordanicus TaxID=2867266 RepID=A0AAW5B366_9BACI|nr:(S)-benzoin forming benzil reductase [Oceanobacillus jordanicus]MCG3418505.1 (S)-benzoin forming benzil reductase [Oceanobacillus jordanicus]
MKYAIVTGVSKGLGYSVAKLLLEQEIHVMGISRSEASGLNKLAEENNVTFQQFQCDLGDVETVEETCSKIKNQWSHEISALYLVNNAAVIDPVDQAMNTKSSELAYHVQVNTIAPMVMTNLFLKEASSKGFSFIGATVTSGAAERPISGWSAYCSTKASINMYTQTVAIEQDERGTGNKVFAFSPGIMDTGMQEKIRAASPEEFTNVETFKSYKEDKALKDTDTVGGVLVDILTNEANIENGKIYNVKDFL